MVSSGSKLGPRLKFGGSVFSDRARLFAWIPAIAAIVLAVGGAAVFGGLEKQLTVGGFTDPNSQSSIAAQQLSDEFGVGTPNVVLLVQSDSDLTGPANQARLSELSQSIERAPGVMSVQSIVSNGTSALLSDDTHETALLVQLSGSEDDVRATVTDLQPTITSFDAGSAFDVQVSGQAEILRQVSDQSRKDLLRAELIAVPVTFVLLLVFFGSLYAALIPVALGVIGMLISMLVIAMLNQVTPISVYSLNLITGLALGLAIDYSLLIVTRYREGLHAGVCHEQALQTAMLRCRRTISISAITVGLCLAVLLSIPLGYLRSLAISGIAVVATVAILTLLVLPPILGRIGPNIDRYAVRRADRASAGPILSLTMRAVERWRITSAATVIALLLILLSPFLGLRLGPVDDRVLPNDAPAHVAANELRESMPTIAGDPLYVYAEATGSAVDTYARGLSELPGASTVVGPSNTYVNGREIGQGNPALLGGLASAVEVIPDPHMSAPEMQRLAADVIGEDAPFETRVAGLYSADIDTQSAITGRLPIVGAGIALAIIPLIFLLTGGVLVTLKTLVITLVSLSASFGVMVFIFQDGHLSELLRFTPTGTIDATSPVLMFCLAFGLSMDYQIFLLARIREEYEATGDNALAVREGLTRTAGVISAAAILIAVVFLAIGTSGISFVKLLGLGLAVAVLVDAFLVRMLLVPSLMLLFGPLNWWAPGPLRRLHNRFGIRESPQESTPEKVLA